MTSLTHEEANELLSGTELKKRSSDLGYFSKPFRVYRGDKAFMVKLYLPVKNSSFVSSIIRNHEQYIAELVSLGLKIPDTVILSKQTGNKYQLVIIQDSFRDDELLRNKIIQADLKELKQLCLLAFNDITKFWKNKNKSIEIGFHPTLRNYALHEGNLSFFDTFPPMMMKQRDLNALILKMSPYGGLIKKLVPLKLINKVTDEYYHLDKMFIGIVGSCCRLRPGDADIILGFSRDYVSQSNSLLEREKESILKLLTKPPDLPRIWILIRKLSGNVGKPNINTPIS
jgi:hypothetical protein